MKYITVLVSFITAEYDTVPAGGSTKITALADGVLIRYIWSAVQLSEHASGTHEDLNQMNTAAVSLASAIQNQSHYPY